MNHRNRFASLLAGIVAAGLMTAPTAAQAEPITTVPEMSTAITPANAAMQKYCVGVVNADRSTSVTCDSRNDSPKLQAAAAARSHLMTWYDNWQFNTDNGVFSWYGDFGTCDSEGYWVWLDGPTFGPWKNRISSFKAHGGCWHTVGFIAPDISDSWKGDTAYVGNEFNDRIMRFRVKNN